MEINVYRTIVLSVGLYGRKAFILMEEQRLREFENRVLRRVFGLKRKGVKQEWKRLHKEELRGL
jgi:hypothetical protein